MSGSETDHDVRLIDPSRLSDRDIEFFAVHGYVVKRRAVDPHLLERTTDTIWRWLPEFRRDDPTTWGQSVCDCRGAMNIDDRFGLVKIRGDSRNDPTLRALTIDNPLLKTYAQQLLGRDNVEMPEGIRGVYPIFPTPRHAGTPVNAHIDVTPNRFALSISVYISDVPVDGGGLSVWPGSHRSLHFACRDTGCDLDAMNTPAFMDALSAWNRTEPVVIDGEAGDVILFHNRLLHAASLNLTPGHVRLAAYMNVWSRQMSAGKRGALWEGWDGVRALGSQAVQDTETVPVSAPSEGYWCETREGLPSGGAWGAFAISLHKAFEREQRRLRTQGVFRAA